MIGMSDAGASGIEIIRYKSLEMVKVDCIKINIFFLAKLKQNLIRGKF